MEEEVTILILIDGFLQYAFSIQMLREPNVTILILIDGFLQLRQKCDFDNIGGGHNPYFNRWFSAIEMLYVKDK